DRNARRRGQGVSCRLYRSCRLRILPGVRSADCRAQARQFRGFLYNTLGESASAERAMYHTISPEGQTELGRSQAAEPAPALRRPELSLAAVRTVRGLKKDLGLAVGKPALDLLEPRNGKSRLACQGNKIDHAPRQAGIDEIGQTLGHGDRHTGGAGEEALLRRGLDRGPVSRHPDAAAGQFAGEIGNHHALGRHDETHESGLGLHVTRDDAAPLRPVLIRVASTAGHMAILRGPYQASASSSSASSPASSSAGSTQPSWTRAVITRCCASSRLMSNFSRSPSSLTRSPFTVVQPPASSQSAQVAKSSSVFTPSCARASIICGVSPSKFTRLSSTPSARAFSSALRFCSSITSRARA